MNVTDILLVLAAVTWVMSRRMAGQLLQAKSLLVLPAVLTIIGITQLRHLHPADVTTVAFIAVSIGLSVVLGLVRGATVHLGERGQELWMRYRVSTVVLWVATLAVKVVAVPLERGVSHASASAAGHALMLSIGLGVLAESAVVLLRALRRRPELVWDKGADGRPHRTLSQVDLSRFTGSHRDW